MNQGETGRVIIVGSNSNLWRRLGRHLPRDEGAIVAISHKEIGGHRFREADIVWILSYSKRRRENARLMEELRGQGRARFVYLSTATVNSVALTRCYAYPRAKAEAEEDAARLLGAGIVRIGLIYDDPAELPSGTSAATDLHSLAALLASPPAATDPPLDFFHMVSRPFGSALERKLFALYGVLMAAARPYPCLLRPLDMLLKLLGMRWYGYLHLSNRLWLQSRRADEGGAPLGS